MPKVKKYNTDEMYNAPFQTLLRELMEKYDVKQEAIGKKIGVARQTISKYASGETIPDIYSAQKIVDYFNTNHNLNYSLEYWLGKGNIFENEKKETIHLTNNAIEKLKKYQKSKIKLFTLEIILNQEGFIERLSEYLITSNLHHIIGEIKTLSDFASNEMNLNYNPYENEKYKYANLLEIIPKLNEYSKTKVMQYLIKNNDILFEYFEKLENEEHFEDDFSIDLLSDEQIEQYMNDIHLIEKEINTSKNSKTYKNLLQEYEKYKLKKEGEK